MPLKGPALVFGASGEEGRAVVEGMVDAGYSPVYGFTRSSHDTYLTDGLGADLIAEGDLENPDHVKNAFTSTKAKAIFLVTTTDLPDDVNQTSGFSDAAEAEYQVIVEFFHLLKAAYLEDGIGRHVVFCTRDNVQRAVREAIMSREPEQSQQQRTHSGDGLTYIEPLDDGSIVPHYSAKGRGAEYALEFLKSTPDLKLTLLTMPFLYSNFLGFFCPLPDEPKTLWTLTACFGDGSNKIDMMGSADLSAIVPNIFANPDKYSGQNIRLVGERISMDEVAEAFADLFGKPVIYNPLTYQEVAALPFATAPAMAQMCQFLGDPKSLRHDLDATKEVCFPKKPQTFKDWLLTHSNSSAFQLVGLDVDAPEILSVTVFGATSPEGVSVVKGLLADSRKKYRIRATSRHVDSDKAKAIKTLDPDRVELVYAAFDDFESCRQAVEGIDGVFLATDFYEEAQRDMEVEERHARNVIDACEAAASVKHLVFSTMESIDEMNRILDLGLDVMKDSKGKDGTVVQFDAKSRAAAYARTKKLSVTYVLMPCYAEWFFELIRRQNEGGDEKLILSVPLKNDTKVMCMSVDDLGPAVANIFDSYQVYSGHEIGLVTDFVSVSDVKDIIEKAFLKDGKSEVVIETEEVKKEDWIEAHDTYMKDLGQMFAYMAHSDAVKMRRSVAKTMKLVPSALPLRQWVEQNVENVSFREKLGLR